MCRNISFYIIKSNAAAATELEKKGWLLVNGKSFWCGLKTAKFSWFPQQQLDTYQVRSVCVCVSVCVVLL